MKNVKKTIRRPREQRFITTSTSTAILAAIAGAASLTTAIASAALVPIAQAATYHPQAKSIYMNGTLLSTPYGIVAGGTTYMPIWYVIQALHQLGIANSWDGVHTTWTITAPASLPVDLTNVVANSNGSNTITLNGTELYHVNRLVYADPASQAATSYMPIWYIMQLLQRMGITSTWDALTWHITTPAPTPEFPTPPPGSSSSATSLPPSGTANGTANGITKTALAWATDATSIAAAEQNAILTQINNDNYNLNADGSVTDATVGLSNPVSQLLNYGHSHNLRVFATVTNINPTSGDFDGAYISALLNNPTTRSAVEQNLLNVAVQDGYAGIDLDLESLAAADQVVFTQFISELAGQLHAANKQFSVTVPAETGAASEPWDSAYNYPAIAKVADLVPIMAYDFSWQTSPAGPIAPLYWDKQVLQYATTVIPTSKILLGLAAYGYDWDTTTGASATDCSLPAIDGLLAQYHVTPSWDSTNAAPYFTYTDASGDHHTVYYENSASLEPKLQLATQYKLTGVAIWQAGSENQAFLDALQAWAGSA